MRKVIMLFDRVATRRGALVVALGVAAAAAYAPAHAAGTEPADILITAGTIVTMDPARRVIDDGAVAIVGNRIAAVGTTAELKARFSPRETIDARRKIVMPGLIDGHGHAGHALLKTLGADSDTWNENVERMYAHGSTPDFWRADAMLAGLERLKSGVTTSVNFFGGGSDVYRVDDAKYGDAYVEGVRQIGVRWFLGVGPRRGPYPSGFTDWTGAAKRDFTVPFDRQLAVSEELIRKWNGTADGRIRMAVVFPTISPDDKLAGAALDEMVREAHAARELSKRYKVLFLQDGHTRGTVKYANDVLGLLGPDAIFSHATNLTDEEIKLIASTGTRISHNPSAIFSMYGRNPATELIDAGATVMLGSDGVAPDRSFDMFRHMFQATRYHRFYFHDAKVLPAGKVLEMATIDAAKALGMEKDIGSLEAGKKADIILVDWFKPHLVPMNMPVYRLVYYANGEDVSTVLVDGRVLMRDRQVLTADEEKILTAAQRESELAVTRAGLKGLDTLPEGFWGSTHLGPKTTK
ncbi:amidohydrolase family protein [Sphingomonas lycopersici]|uniref:Amidohydrolase family protein n=1 Tax=Sphingomonas lycopersici TaxID=2951807 RepID=A0AA41ZHR8_9SPHN|nr:amidohydrolase family protein [Sphingomonas lycopersici]MCW6535918.1 amidohydrolase family protein [Sphingomonas lycopersici]